jgi:hypothetical protein
MSPWLTKYGYPGHDPDNRYTRYLAEAQKNARAKGLGIWDPQAQSITEGDYAEDLPGWDKRAEALAEYKQVVSPAHPEILAVNQRKDAEATRSLIGKKATLFTAWFEPRGSRNYTTMRSIPGRSVPDAVFQAESNKRVTVKIIVRATGWSQAKKELYLSAVRGLRKSNGRYGYVTGDVEELSDGQIGVVITDPAQIQFDPPASSRPGLQQAAAP